MFLVYFIEHEIGDVQQVARDGYSTKREMFFKQKCSFTSSLHKRVPNAVLSRSHSIPNLWSLEGSGWVFQRASDEKNTVSTVIRFVKGGL